MQLNDKVYSNFVSPKHLGLLNTCHVGESGNLLCGDSIKMSVDIDDSGTIKDAKFQSFGCIYSFVCAEETAEMCIGKDCGYAKQLTANDVDAAMGGLPNGKIHCAEMAVNALKRAVEPKTEEKKVEIPIKTAREVKHIIAETFDEFIIPEGASKGIEIHLKEVDPISKKIYVIMKNGSVTFKSFVREILKRIDDFTIYFN